MNNIILLFGGDSCERDISIITAHQLYENIDKSKYNVYPIYIYMGKMYYVPCMDIDRFIDYKPKIHNLVHISSGYLYKHRLILGHKRIKIDNAVLATHGGDGENGALSGLLEMNNIAYTSSSMLASSVLMDKVITKHILSSLNIPYLDYIELHNYDDIDYVNIVNNLGLPLIVKPSRLGSSIGVGLVTNIDSLKDAIDLAFYYDDKIIVEKALTDFREYNIALFRCNGEFILSDIESPKVDTILDFNDKYMTSGKMNGGYREFPAKVSKNIKRQIEEYALKVYKTLDMRGVARVDYLVKDSNVYLNEVNTIPGSLAYYLFERKGISYQNMIDMMIDESSVDMVNNDKLIKYYKSSVLKSAKSTHNKLRK